MALSKNILVSGAAGFLGLKVVQILLQKGYNVTALVKDIKPQPPYSESNQFNWLVRDIASSPLTTEEANCYDTIVHLAGATDRRGDIKQMHISANEMTTIGLTSHQSRSIKKFIYTSSQVVYGNPNSKYVDETFPIDPTYSSYATSKINSENWLRLYQAQRSNSTICLRLCGFVDGGGLIDTLISEFVAGNDIELFGQGKICRDYIHTGYFLSLILNLLESDLSNEYTVLNVGSGQAVSAHSVASTILELVNSNSKIILSPEKPIRSDFVYKTDKLLSYTKLFIPSLQEQIIGHVKSNLSQSAPLSLIK